MKTMKLIISTILLLIFNNMLAQDCEAFFYPEFDNADEFTVHFYDGSIPSGSIESWLWDFGDENTSTEQNPTHTYSEEGAFWVSLTITTDLCSDTYEDSVVVQTGLPQTCEALFYYQITGPDLLTVQFFDYSNSSQTIDSWYWDFGDGSSGTDQDPIKVYVEDSTYFVTLFITSGEFTDSLTKAVSVGEGFYMGDTCIASFSYDQLDPSGHTFQFYNGSYMPGDTLENYFWDFGDGNTSNAYNPVNYFEEDGEYTVSLTISGNMCNNTYSTSVFAGENNWYPENCQALFWFLVDPDDFLSYQFNDFSYGDEEILSWYWNFGDGYMSTLQNPVHNFQTEGTYNSYLEINTQNCQSTFPLELNVYENANTADSLMPLFYPEILGDLIYFHNLTRGGADGWFWDFGDGANSTDFSPVHSYDEPGIHQVALSAFRGPAVNTIVIEFDTSPNKDEKFENGIDHAYFYPGGILNVNDLDHLSFSVYPNPAGNTITVSCSEENAEISIYDLTGKLIFNKKNSKEKIMIGNLPSGICILKVSGENISGTVKFVKE